MMTTYFENPVHVKETWHLVDADGKTLGRLAARVAGVLRGKHRPTFTPNVDIGDHVVIINAEKIHLTGGKLDKKLYHRHTGYPGGLKTASAKHVFQKDPAQLLITAIEGMLPKTPLGNGMAKKLRVYAGPNHPHQAQQPQPISL
ncbi:MAG: 50S ribosomal protein L13 [Nitrospira sp.]|jgi:large subunit ribosomal protein L13|uniref:Large ribosomal subunit protein uL13 n=1 Tax=Candidatus Nitrospira nitrosa TaxID=1742972 RepID=A0A0S4LGB2_9BACT|nr:50S ribosomal protein L13 [Candidatus Nitrospira nitrosa]MBK8274420.1 50S ribosomal protein L13 [Nitrospira sp.]OYT18446.1 MAG: 50S ribosomal protein L13 [Nitrospira sp. UW-LDO-01]MBK9948819.1 50S ribosomal protein L13 [Nitrospira sp.]MBL8053893.1 50S ribosomal protein L13 [Nitrospira sp.]MBS0152831.1 50S ribosomal protein L13 [Nitrospira sp.]